MDNRELLEKRISEALDALYSMYDNVIYIRNIEVPVRARDSFFITYQVKMVTGIKENKCWVHQSNE